MRTGHPQVQGSWQAGQRPDAQRLARPLREFLAIEAGGGVMLLAATTLALVWANSPWRAGYETMWATGRQLVAIAAVAGIGSSISLFIASLADPRTGLDDQARVGSLARSLLAAGLGVALLRGALPAAHSPPTGRADHDSARRFDHDSARKEE